MRNNILSNYKGGLLSKREANTFKIQTWRRWHNSIRSIKAVKYQLIVNQYPISEKEKKEIDNFFVSNYGKKIPYDCHRYYAAHSGVMIPEYFPDIIYFPYFERFMNAKFKYAVFEDKNILPFVAREAGILMPTTVLSCVMGLYRDSKNVIITREKAISILKESGKVFCKPSTHSSGGHGCFVFDFGDTKADINRAFLRLGDEFVVQELVSCEQSINSLYPLSVNTFRITTYRWKDEFYTMPVAMRLGQNGSIVDNASSGGMFIGVNNDGTLLDYALTVDNCKFTEHPDTHFVFKRHRIKNFDKVIEAAKKMHSLLPQLGVIGWDFTVNEEGTPLLIEANIGNASYRLGQMSHGLPAFGERTAEVLQWIRKMKKMPYSKFNDHLFGN